MWGAEVLILIFAILSFAKGQCPPNTCGVNTVCTLSVNGAAVCRCRSGYNHRRGSNTVDGCPIRINNSQSRFPSSNRDRPFGQTRNDGFTPNPCSSSPCGFNADCRPVGDRPLCTCLPRHMGDPYTECLPDPCDSSPCGTGAECTSNGNTAICKCPRGYNGDPYTRCYDNPCNGSPCAPNADCTVNGNRAVCKCRANYEGDGYSQCVLDPCIVSPCGINADCQKSSGEFSSRAVCRCRQGYEGDPYSRCNLDPCYDNPCGVNADCSARGNSAVCKCFSGYVGDPYRGCELDPCANSPCGVEAECQSQGTRAICSCPQGYSGDPYRSCRLDPCSQDPCGTNAECTNNGNFAACRCPRGYQGDPNIACVLDPCGASSDCGLNTECQASGDRALCRCRKGYSGDPNTRSGCRSDPCSAINICGVNAECRNRGSRPVCECLPGHKGDAYTQCFRGDCVSNSECQFNQACKNYRCVDPCATSCGSGADCTVQNHVAICRCPRGYTGDPSSSCRRLTRQEICSQCGPNTDCQVSIDDRPICKCKQNHIGNPLTGCRTECESDRECPNSQLQCISNRCQPACLQDVCGDNANCVARNHRATCTCPEYFLGDPYSRCYTECTSHDDCAGNKACVKFRCENPCEVPDPNVCGIGADCEAKMHKVVCSCPRGYTGDPFKSCRKFTRADLCTPNPCGAGAICQPGTDSRGNDRPVCTCPSGYRGDAIIACTRGL